jgi:hypothetical protein
MKNIIQMSKLPKLLVLLFITLLPFYAMAVDDYKNDINDLVVKEMKVWLQNDVIAKTLISQNEKSSLLSPTDMKILENSWHSEKRKTKRPLMEKVLENDLAKYLKTLKENSEGLFTELIIIDAYGLNAGQTIVSENYWQGETQKWKNTLGSRSYGTYISELGFDYNTEFFQVEVAFIITQNDEPIGVFYAGVDIDQIEDWKKKMQQ